MCVCFCLLLLLLFGCILFCLFACLPGRFVIRGVPLIDADPGFVGPFDLVELMIFLSDSNKSRTKAAIFVIMLVVGIHFEGAEHVMIHR